MAENKGGEIAAGKTCSSALHYEGDDVHIRLGNKGTDHGISLGWKKICVALELEIIPVETYRWSINNEW
jgi:hypothetical protein